MTVPTSRSDGKEVLGLRGMGKQFSGTWVVENMELSIRSGQVLALVGENGAGKSTMVKTLAGVHLPDAGSVVLDGAPVVFGGPKDSQQRGIEVIHQHPNLFPDLSVAENIYLAHPPRRHGVLDRRAMRRDAAGVLRRLGVDIAVDRPVSGLSLADQQLIEIAKALTRRARVLILDEPTAALSGHEVDRLFSIIRSLKADGVGLLLVNHRLDEVYAVCDRITVIRDGHHVVTSSINEMPVTECVRHMVGREVSMLYPDRSPAFGPIALEVTGLSRRGVFEDVSFSVRHGEVVGMAGLIGAGRTEIARVLFGADPGDRGTVHLEGKRVSIASPADAVAHGMAYVPEDRHRSGLALELPVRENLSLPRLRSLSRFLVVDRGAERALVGGFVKRLRIKTASDRTLVGRLSGGNQQKVVISRWLSTDPSVFILDEPTQGVDIGAKSEVHKIIAELADAGMAILLISSDLPELLGLADTVLVVRDGRIVDCLDRADASQERVMQAALGQQVA